MRYTIERTCLCDDCKKEYQNAGIKLDIRYKEFGECWHCGKTNKVNVCFRAVECYYGEYED